MADQTRTAKVSPDWHGPACDDDRCPCATPGPVCNDFIDVGDEGRCPRCGWLERNHQEVPDA